MGVLCPALVVSSAGKAVGIQRPFFLGDWFCAVLFSSLRPVPHLGNVSGIADARTPSEEEQAFEGVSVPFDALLRVLFAVVETPEAATAPPFDIWLFGVV